MKNIRLFILLIAVVLLCLPLTGYSQDKDVWPSYYSVNTNPANHKPSAGSPWWTSTSTINPESPLILALNDVLWIGVTNWMDTNNVKSAHVYITATKELKFDTLIAYKKDSTSPPSYFSYGTVESTVVGGVYKYSCVIDPQPAWEVWKFTNTQGNPDSILYITGGSYCTFAPALTSYGLAILILMLIAAAYFVYRRRRAVAA
jgi:hypothetical protein